MVVARNSHLLRVCATHLDLSEARHCDPKESRQRDIRGQPEVMPREEHARHAELVVLAVALVAATAAAAFSLPHAGVLLELLEEDCRLDLLHLVQTWVLDLTGYYRYEEGPCRLRTEWLLPV